MAPLALVRAEAICKRKFDMTFQGMIIKSKFIFVTALLPIFHEMKAKWVINILQGTLT